MSAQEEEGPSGALRPSKEHAETAGQAIPASGLQFLKASGE